MTAKKKDEHRGYSVLKSLPIRDAAAVAHWFGFELGFKFTQAKPAGLAKRPKKAARTRREGAKNG